MIIQGVSFQRTFAYNSVSLRIRRSHTFFGRFEWAEKDGLFPVQDPRAVQSFDVGKLDGGYLYDFPILGPVAIGVGFSASVHFLPEDLDSVYGGSRPDSYLAFARFKLK